MSGQPLIPPFWTRFTHVPPSRCAVADANGKTYRAFCDTSVYGHALSTTYSEYSAASGRRRLLDQPQILGRVRCASGKNAAGDGPVYAACDADIAAYEGVDCFMVRISIGVRHKKKNHILPFFCRMETPATGSCASPAATPRSSESCVDCFSLSDA